MYNCIWKMILRKVQSVYPFLFWKFHVKNLDVGIDTNEEKSIGVTQKYMKKL